MSAAAPPQPPAARDLYAAIKAETGGYQALGDLMGSRAQIAIFRKFRNAGTLDLLYRQADLEHTLKRWAKHSQKDKSSGDDDRKYYDFDFYTLQNSAGDLSDKGAQWREWMEVSDKLGVFYEKLLRFQKISSLAPVNRTQLTQLRHFLSDEDKAGNFLAGSNADVYKNFEEDYSIADLTAIAHPEEPDLFTRLARDWVIASYHRLTGQDTSNKVTKVPRLVPTTNDVGLPKNFRDIPMKEYNDNTTLRIARGICALLVTGLVTLAIGTLNYPGLASWRLWLIWIYNFTFTGILALTIHIKPVELFALAAAFAAVLVVFASNPFSLDNAHSS